MLLNLYIRDFGIIEQTELNFSAGLNVLSGETGAGKSIIIEAIQVVTGGRGSAEFVRSGCERAIVQATVEAYSLQNLLTANGIADNNEGIIILTREINKNGRSTCRINGQIVTLSFYRDIGQVLIDIQGQHDQQLLFMTERQMHLLDTFGGPELLSISREVAQTYEIWLENTRRLKTMTERQREWSRRLDTINYQINEIDAVSPSPGEDETLQAERNKLANAERISRLLAECSQYLKNGGETGSSVLELTGKSLKCLNILAELDSGLQASRDAVTEAYYRIEEASRDISQYIDGMDFFPARLEQVEERLDRLDRVKKKYGPTIEDVIKYREEIELEKQQMDSAEEVTEKLVQEIKSAEAKLEEASDRLSTARKKTATIIEEKITGELKDLGMTKAVFSVGFTRQEHVTAKGREKAEFYISANPGEPVKPLSKIASGGEASRILLAVKSILAEIEEIPCLVFDEVDSGIGGITVHSVAKKLYYLAKNKQVICVTHSPIVASVAATHLLIRKKEQAGRTLAEVISLDKDQKIEELARMLGGKQGEGAAMEHARQLIKDACKINKK